jgi:putative SOS response-associated peptidase YedK
MCGRYALNATPAQIRNHFGNLLPDDDAWNNVPTKHSYNIAPSVNTSIIRYSKGLSRNKLDLANWGFRPQWAKRAWINARNETLFKTAAFRDAAQRHRCLVLATGWYEWQDVGGKQKQPYYIRLDRLFAFAGIWVSHKAPRAGTRHLRSSRRQRARC